MVQATVIKWAIIAAVVLGLVGGVWLKITRLTMQRDHAVMDLMEMTGKYNRSQHDLEEATRSKAELTAAMQKAGRDRELIRGQLEQTLRSLRAQKPPSECKAAITWAVEQKEDLQWPK